MVLDSGKDEEEENRHGHADGAENAHVRDMVERSRQGQDDTGDGTDDAEGDGAEGVVTEGVEDLGGRQDVETNEEDVVGEEHEGSGLVGESALAEEKVSNVANVANVGVLHHELPHGVTGDPEEDTGEESGDECRSPTENAEGPGLRHDGKADLVSEEESCRLLPSHGPELDVMIGLFLDQILKSRIDGVDRVSLSTVWQLVNGLGVDVDVTIAAFETVVFLGLVIDFAAHLECMNEKGMKE